MKQDGCTKVAMANDKDTYGQGLARLVELKAKDVPALNDHQRRRHRQDGVRTTARSRRSIKAQGADCFLFGGVTANGAVQLYKDVGAALPSAKLYGPDGVCESGLHQPVQEGHPEVRSARASSARSRRWT